MQKAVLIARILLGLVFAVFAANYVLKFIPIEANETAGDFDYSLSVVADDGEAYF